MIADWPAKQRAAATTMMTTCGQPTETGDRMRIWFGNGSFVKTVIARDEAPHDFPMAHIDFLTQTVKHRVRDKSSAYVKGLMFQQNSNTADPDTPHAI